MKNKNSVAVHEIPLRLLKYGKHTLADTIAILINKSLEFGQFPNILKLGKLIPLHKKVDHNMLENYRPIIILSYLFKISEKTVATRLYNYLEEKKILPTASMDIDLTNQEN